MEIVWNKVIIWIIAVVTALVIIVMLVAYLNPGTEGSLIERFFAMLDTGLG